MEARIRARRVAALLAEELPDPRCELDYRSVWELLVATMLSAQCTDERVNRVTPELFRRWPDAATLAAASQEEVEGVIYTTGFYRNKARALRRAAAVIVERFGGEVPRDLAGLMTVPGVGRKTAAVVLGEGYRIPAGIPVDTHVRRVARRLGLTRSSDPDKIARDLEELIPRDEWVDVSLRMVLHGRRVCMARHPRCAGCALVGVCERVGV